MRRLLWLWGELGRDYASVEHDARLGEALQDAALAIASATLLLVQLALACAAVGGGRWS